MTPYLCVEDGLAALNWYTEAFGATVGAPWLDDSGKIGHVELTLGGQPVFLSESHPDYGVEPPLPGRGVPVTLVLTVANCLASTERARSLGATVTRDPDDQGERIVATIIDPAGHRWMLVEDR